LHFALQLPPMVTLVHDGGHAALLMGRGVAVQVVVVVLLPPPPPPPIVQAVREMAPPADVIPAGHAMH
jgi:hypothetical protein